MQQSAGTEAIYGFLGVFDAESNKGVKGAAMTTNLRGFPLEFRVTTPVRPSAVQTALYGDSLEPFVTNELLGNRLADSIKVKPTVFLVNRLSGLELNADVPVGFISHTDNYVHTESNDASYTVMQPPPGMNLAIATVTRTPTDHGELGILLIEAFRHFDLVSVFSRMETALNVLSDSDDRYK